MTHRTFRIVALAAVALAGAAGLTIVATDDCPADRDGGLLGHLHELGRRLHGQASHEDHMARLIEQLQLTPEQQHRLERIHEIMETYGGEDDGTMAELHHRLMTQFGQGRVETDEIRRVIDRRVERTRDMAYAVTDELVALVNGLDPGQREIVSAHLRHVEGGHPDHGR